VAMDINHRTWRIEDKGRLGLETTKKSPLLEREQDNRRVCILVMRLLAWICVASRAERTPGGLLRQAPIYFENDLTDEETRD